MILRVGCSALNRVMSIHAPKVRVADACLFRVGPSGHTLSIGRHGARYRGHVLDLCL